MVKTIKQTLTSHIPFRHGVRRELRRIEHLGYKGVEVSVFEDKGLLSSTFHLTVTGEVAAINRFVKALQAYAHSL